MMISCGDDRRHCEERSGEAIYGHSHLDRFAVLAMTGDPHAE
jgi:hypothetical protein